MKYYNLSYTLAAIVLLAIAFNSNEWYIWLPAVVIGSAVMGVVAWKADRYDRQSKDLEVSRGKG